MFSTLLEKFLPLSSNSHLLSADSFSLEESKICHFGKGWKLIYIIITGWSFTEVQISRQGTKYKIFVEDKWVKKGNFSSNGKKIVGKDENTGEPGFSYFHAPTMKSQGHIVLPLSVCPNVCLHKLNMKTWHFLFTSKLIQLQGSYLVWRHISSIHI